MWILFGEEPTQSSPKLDHRHKGSTDMIGDVSISILNEEYVVTNIKQQAC